MAKVLIHPGEMAVGSKRLFGVAGNLSDIAARLRAEPPPLPATAAGAAYLRQREDVITKLAKVGTGLSDQAVELRRRAGLIEESPFLKPGTLGTLTLNQRRWLLPTGPEAVLLKQKLAILAKQLGIALPKGFNPNRPVTGAAARQLLRMINVALGGKGVGGYNNAVRRRLRSIRLPVRWQDLLQYPGNQANDQRMACWLAANARQRGISPYLPVMCAIPESGIENLSYGDRDSVGFFQIRAGIHPAPSGFGSASGRIQSASWWVAHPEAQMAWFTNTAKAAARESPSRNVNTTDPDRLARWAIDVERCASQYEYKYRDAYKRAKQLVDKCVQLHGPAGGSAATGGAGPSGGLTGGGSYLYPGGEVAIILKHKLEILARRLKVPIPGNFSAEFGGTGAGTRALILRLQKKLGLPQSGGFDVHVRRRLREISWVPPGSPFAERALQKAKEELRKGSSSAWRYQALTGTPGQAWCASFISWIFKKAGDRSPFVSASVGNWVSAARKGENGLKVVSAAEARPGDIVCYDWDGGSDFYGRSHVGLITGGDSPRFNTIHGNWSGTIANSTLTVGGGSGTVDGYSRGQVVFIRVER